jgi:hypothetical protein
MRIKGGECPGPCREIQPEQNKVDAEDRSPEINCLVLENLSKLPPDHFESQSANILKTDRG